MATRKNLQLKPKRLKTKAFGDTSKKPINKAVRARHVKKRAKIAHLERVKSGAVTRRKRSRSKRK